MRVPCILGMDPGFAAFGYAVVEIGRVSDRVARVGVIRTQKATAKRAVYAADDNVRRCEEIADALLVLLREFNVVCFSAEAMSFPRSASVAAKMALSWGAVATVAHVHDPVIPIIQATPQKIKKTLCGSNSASKEDVAAELVKRYSYLPSMLVGLPAGIHEHAYDALGAAEVLKDSDVIRLARRMS